MTFKDYNIICKAAMFEINAIEALNTDKNPYYMDIINSEGGRVKWEIVNRIVEYKINND